MLPMEEGANIGPGKEASLRPWTDLFQAQERFAFPSVLFHENTRQFRAFHGHAIGTEPGWECRSLTRGFHEVCLLLEERKYLRALPGVVGIPTWPEGVSHPTASPQDIPDFPAATGCPTQSFIS